MTNLLHARCQVDVQALNARELHDHLAQLSGWHENAGAIEKTFVFRNYHETVSFVNAVAWIANTEDHHPELRVTYDRCVVRFWTHSVGGISRNDLICAAKTDELVRFVA
jgi:4a-hydroxytetrahydrobiopterin dehydratase